MATNNSINLTDSGIVSYDGAGTFAGRTLAGTTDFIDVTNGDGISGAPTFDIADNFEETGMHGWNGSILETTSVTVAAAGGTITLSVERSGGGDLTVVASTGYLDWDTTPADTVTLTAGTDTVPVLNYVYWLVSTTTLTASTSGWPAAEHVPIASVFCQSAASLQTDGPYKMHDWTNDVTYSNESGHISDLNYWIRSQDATWIDGVAQTFSITTNVGTPDNVVLTTASGNVLQLHPNDFPAFSGTPDVYVVNDSSTAYNKVTDLNALLTDSTGASMSGRYFTLVIWGCVSEDSSDCKLFCNLPSGSYASESELLSDGSRYANYSIPSEFKGCGFLIAAWDLRHQTTSGGTWTSIQEIDLRGQIPPRVAGATPTFPNDFIDNVFRILDDGDQTKKIAFQADQITTSTTRTITMADQDIDLTPTTGSFQASDADLTALSALSSTGFVARTGVATYAERTLTEGAGIDITNGDGVSGNPTITFDVTEVSTIATDYVTDSGTANPSSNILNVVGGTGISVSGSGNTVTISDTGGTSGVWTYVTSASPSGVNEVVFTDLTSTGFDYLFVFENLVPSRSVGLRLRSQFSLDNGSTFQTTGYAQRGIFVDSSSVSVASASGFFELAEHLDDSATDYNYIEFQVNAPYSTNKSKSVLGRTAESDNGSARFETFGGGFINSNEVDAIRFYLTNASDTIDGGTILVYRRSNS